MGKVEKIKYKPQINNLKRGYGLNREDKCSKLSISMISSEENITSEENIKLGGRERIIPPSR